MKENLLIAAIAALPVATGLNDASGAGLYLANEAALADTNFSRPLTEYVTGWMRQPGLLADLDAIAPPVPVSRRFEYRKMKNAEGFLSEDDDVRAIDADFKRVTYSGDIVDSSTLNKGLTLRIDRERIVGPNYLERQAAALTDRLIRNDLRRAIDIIDGLDNGTSKTWATTAQPDSDLDDLIEASADAAGVYPNTIIFDQSSWALRRRHLRGLDAAGGMAAMMSPAELAAMLNVDRVVVLRHRYTTKKSDTAKTKVSNLRVRALYLSPVPTEDDASNVKRFYTPASGGSIIGVHVDDTKAKFVDLTVEHYSRIVGTSTVGCKRYNVAAS